MHRSLLSLIFVIWFYERKIVGSLKMKTKMFNIIKIYFITDIIMLHWGGPMFAHSPSNLVSLLSQYLFTVEAKVLGFRMGVLAEL